MAEETTAVAPDLEELRVEIANGPPIVLPELWRGSHVLLWFSRGLMCPFCRRQMVQFGQIHDELRGAGVATVQVTPADLEVGRKLVAVSPVAWAYGCDPSGRLAEAFALTPQGGSVAGAIQNLRQQVRAWRVLAAHPAEPAPALLPVVAAESAPPAREGGMLLLDRAGVVRYRQQSGNLALLPPNQEILRVVRAAVAAAG